MKRIIIFSLLIISLPNLGKAFLVENDKDYYKTKNENIGYIYPLEYRKHLPKVIDWSSQIYKIYQKSFGYSLDERPWVVLASTRNQVPNAFATVLPHILNVNYFGGTAMVEYMASPSWLKLLLTHETSHLFQMDARQGFSKFTRTIFGNYLLFLYPVVPIPVFVTPNALIPTFLVEGNAVFNESRFKNGGRLYSGEARAMFYALLKSNLLDENRLTNNHLSFPYRGEKYLVGAYFNLYLAAEHGVSKLNKFFKTQSKHFFWPMILNSTFEEQFGRGYSRSIKDFIKHYRHEARKQQKIQGENLLQAQFIWPFNADDEKIYFLSNKNGKVPNSLNVFDKRTHKLTQKSTYLMGGKLFEVKKGNFYVATSSLYDKDQIIYGLWNKNKELLPGTNSKLILDIKGSKTLYFDMKKSFDSPHLYQNNRFVSLVNSKALSDKDNNIYYFKQEGENKVLYKNKERLTSFKGYYAKMSDISGDDIYFISCTPYGYSLYAFNQLSRQISRLSQSDVIHQAKIITPGQALVAELTSKDYQFKVISLNKVNQRPTYYSYFYENNEKKVENLESPTNLQEIPYNSLTSIRFNQWYINYNSNNELSLTSNFSDTLDYNRLGLAGIVKEGDREQHEFHLRYLNKRHLLNWMFTFSYDKVSRDSHYRSHPISKAGVGYPLLDWHNFQLYGSSYLFYIMDVDDPVQYYFNLNLKNEIFYSLGYSPYRLNDLTAEYLHDHYGDEISLMDQVIFDIGDENYLQGELDYRYSDTYSLEWGEPLNDSKHLIPTQDRTLYRRSIGDSSLWVWRASIGIEKALNYSLYFKKFPLSLRRFAPRIFASYLSFSKYPNDDQEWGGGLSTELLLVHLFPLRLNFDWIKRSSDSASTLLISVGSDY